MIARVFPIVPAVLAAGVLVGGCKREPAAQAEEAGASVTVIGSETVVVVDSIQLRTGPVVSGTLMPERRADVRAELAGTVLETYVDPGQRVKRGTLLGRIDDRAVRDAYLSAKAAVRSAGQNRELARRNAERNDRLAAAGAVAERDREAAASAAANADAAYADAQARLTQAADQLAHAEVRSPLDGVVSERHVSGGDVVQTGDALFNIVDPRSLELAGTVPAEQVVKLKPGAPVEFTVSGYAGRTFNGTVDRINPSADPATRQVRVYATIPNAEQGLVAGLYAEGQIGTDRRTTLLVPLSAVNQRGVTPMVLVVKGGRVAQQAVELGVRDPATDQIEIRGGLEAGDTVLVGAATAIQPGVAVRVEPADVGGER
ncbi:MAG TPA: efflux RND transporter periplasmic adaptor subunit [Gemmatimonadales bacterium]|nr:efflux RND transporter periplasmic adaptor subunit [Gemmatimonadales bacterium]